MEFPIWGFGARAMESIGIFSLISAGAGFCPNGTKQRLTLQNKSRGIWLLSGEQVDVHMVRKGAGDSFLHFDKKVNPGNWSSVKMRKCSTGSSSRQGWDGDIREGKPGMKFCRALEMRRKALLNMCKIWWENWAYLRVLWCCFQGWRCLWGWSTGCHAVHQRSARSQRDLSKHYHKIFCVANSSA